MVETFDAAYVSLHVRATNYAAHHLYRDSLQVHSMLKRLHVLRGPVLNSSLLA